MRSKMQTIPCSNLRAELAIRQDAYRGRDSKGGDSCNFATKITRDAYPHTVSKVLRESRFQLLQVDADFTDRANRQSRCRSKGNRLPQAAAWLRASAREIGLVISSPVASATKTGCKGFNLIVIISCLPCAPHRYSGLHLEELQQRFMIGERFEEPNLPEWKVDLDQRKVR